jgi:SNF2 family DNA or RNA helicase
VSVGTLRFYPPGSEIEVVRNFTGQAYAGVWEVRARADVITRVKRLFPRASNYRTGAIFLHHTPEVARDLEWILTRWPLDLDEDAARVLPAEAEKHRQTEQAVRDILAGNVPHLAGGAWMELARPAREYQLVAADLALATGRLLLADDLGLGKTMSGLLVLRNPDALPALVVCPTHLPRQWESEIAKTLPLLRTHIIRKSTPYDPSQVRGSRGHQPDVLITGYGKLRGWGDHLAGRIRTVIFDEAQELRRADSQKYVAAAQIADGARYRLGLTATPVYNYGGEIHNILQVIAPDVLGDREEFGREWCVAGWSDKASVRDPAGLGVYLRDQGVMLRRTRAEVGRELPEVVRVPHSIESDGDVFDELAQDAADLAEMIVARAAPRQELWKASGEFDWKMRHATGVAKAPYVAEFVRMLLETDERVVLFGWHRDVYEIWQDKLTEYLPVFYTGTESPTQKERARDAFLSGDSRLLIMSLRSGAGLDGLQDAAHVAVFGELDWSPGMHDQCIGRLHRDGQGEPVVAYFLVSDHGADPVMAEVLNLKRQQSEPLRDPDAPLFVEATNTGDRVRLLAKQVLAKRRRAA